MERGPAGALQLLGVEETLVALSLDLKFQKLGTLGLETLAVGILVLHQGMRSQWSQTLASEGALRACGTQKRPYEFEIQKKEFDSGGLRPCPDIKTWMRDLSQQEKCHRYHQF